MIRIARTYWIAILATCSLLGCNNDSSDQVYDEPDIESFELIDPTPGPRNYFGKQVVVLANGNIVVTSPFDSSYPPRSGAVHLFNPYTQSVISSFYGGSSEGDVLVLGGGVVALPNSNFVIVSPATNDNGLLSTGSVRLMDGETGLQLGITQVGDNERDRLGYYRGVIALTNGNFVIASSADNVGGIEFAGSIRLMDGQTGLRIGSDIVGNNIGDELGSEEVVALDNGNYVIASPWDDINGVEDAGSVMLVDGKTNSVISKFEGDNPQDAFGALGVKKLTNGNFIVFSPADDVGGRLDAGSVRLVDGSSGLQIGPTFSGDDPDDEIGEDGIYPLPNGNYVVVSANDNVNGMFVAGSARLFSGATGFQIGAAIAGEDISDALGMDGLIVLPNSNFVIGSSRDKEAGLELGSVILADGETGAQIGPKIVGDVAGDLINVELIGLANDNFVIAAKWDDENGIQDAGTVTLVDGLSGAPINSVAGDQIGDQLSFGSVVGLKNNNFVVTSTFDDQNGVEDAGSILLIDGDNGLPIGSPLAGDSTGDMLGDVGAFSLSNGDFIVISTVDDQDGIVDAGSIMVVDGETAELKQTLKGISSGDIYTPATFSFPDVIDSEKFQFYLLALPGFDRNGVQDSGRVLLEGY